MPMNIFYDDKTKTWQCDCRERLVIGKNRLPLINDQGTFRDPEDGFHVKKFGDKVGPFIGILTSKENRRDFYGNRATFKRIQRYLQQYGGISFVMIPEGLKDDHVDGYIFHKGEWREMRFPLPDIIYNRVVSYRAERGKGLATVKALATKYAIPFYNPHFFEKWEMYTHLRRNPKIAKHLPQTDLLTSKNQMQKWLQQEREVFIKATLSNRGEGVGLVTVLDDGFQLASNTEKQQFSCIDEVWDELRRRFKRRTLIVQKKIWLKDFESRPFDLRVLVQRCKDVWNVSGIGVRCAGENSITTHVPKGGSILPLEHVQEHLNIEAVHDLATVIAYQLELTYGYLCEFSMDVGVDQEDRIWLFEVNSKPMKFDEPHIQEKALHGLVQCFYDDAGFEF